MGVFDANSEWAKLGVGKRSCLKGYSLGANWACHNDLTNLDGNGTWNIGVVMGVFRFSEKVMVLKLNSLESECVWRVGLINGHGYCTENGV